MMCSVNLKIQNRSRQGIGHMKRTKRHLQVNLCLRVMCSQQIPGKEDDALADRTQALYALEQYDSSIQISACDWCPISTIYSARPAHVSIENKTTICVTSVTEKNQSLAEQMQEKCVVTNLLVGLGTLLLFSKPQIE